jgi:hypothetical protein
VSESDEEMIDCYYLYLAQTIAQCLMAVLTIVIAVGTLTGLGQYIKHIKDEKHIKRLAVDAMIERLEIAREKAKRERELNKLRKKAGFKCPECKMMCSDCGKVHYDWNNPPPIKKGK